MRSNDDDSNTLTVMLGFTPARKTLAARRAELWGSEPDEPTEVELREPAGVARPAAARPVDAAAAGVGLA